MPLGDRSAGDDAIVSQERPRRIHPFLDGAAYPNLEPLPVSDKEPYFCSSGWRPPGLYIKA